jgi:hypothetical protein
MDISAFTRVFDALWKSGYRFSDKDMRKSRNLGRIPIRPERDAPERAAASWRARHLPFTDAAVMDYHPRLESQ